VVHFVLEFEQAEHEQLVAPVPYAANPFRRAHGLDGKFVVLYSGNMGQYHYFDDVLQAAERLRDEPALEFVFIGDGVRRAAIEAWVSERGLPNVRLLPYQPTQQLTHSLSAGDLHLVTLMTACTGLAVPSKSYGILAAGRPILYQGHPSGEIARLITDEGIGAVVEIGDVEGLVQSIRRYAGSPTLAQNQGQRARRLVEGPYSRAAALARYEAVLTRASATRPVSVTSEASLS
jgi:glycosyltransferase involved in cell wall biosynthesis